MNKVTIASLLFAFAATSAFAFIPNVTDTGGISTPVRLLARSQANFYSVANTGVTSPQTIVGVRFARDLAGTGSWPVAPITFANYTIKIGTSDKLTTDGEYLSATALSMDAYFDTGDVVTARTGPLTIAAGAYGPAGAWGPVIPFSTPFTYSGTKGLQFAYEHTGGVGDPAELQQFVGSGDYAAGQTDSIANNTAASAFLNTVGAANVFWFPLVVEFVTATTVSGSLTLENTAGANAAETIEWTLTPTAGGSSFTGTLNITDTAPGNAYSFNIPAGAGNGAYSLKFKGGTFLSKTISVLLNGSNLTAQDATLKNGDIDQDGEVGPGDFEAVVAQFGGAGDADVDNDNEVGPSDFETVVGNFGLGDE